MRCKLIISHKYRFIFLKSSKTAGTSMEIALSRFCGDQDIITPLGAENESMRSRLKYPGHRNCGAPVRDYRLRDVARLLVRRQRKLRFYNHIPAAEIRNYIGEKIWNDYFKFCFERNPWDRVISWYYWRCQSEPRPTLSEFIESDALYTLKQNGFDLYTIDGQIAVDRIFLFENLGEELENLREILGFPETPRLPNAASAYRKDHRHYRDVLSPDQKERIGRIFSNEINMFGYEF